MIICLENFCLKLLNNNWAKVTIIMLLIILHFFIAYVKFDQTIGPRYLHLSDNLTFSVIKVQVAFSYNSSLGVSNWKKRRNLITTRSSRNVWFMLTWISSAKNLIKLLIMRSCFSGFVNINIWNMKYRMKPL